MAQSLMILLGLHRDVSRLLKISYNTMAQSLMSLLGINRDVSRVTRIIFSGDRQAGCY